VIVVRASGSLAHVGEFPFGGKRHGGVSEVRPAGSPTGSGHRPSLELPVRLPAARG